MARILTLSVTSMAMLAGLIGIQLPVANSAENNDPGSAALELFEQRIMPIFRSPTPSSCVQCHLASVELKNYILPSHEKTFVSLRDQGLIDIAEPEKSKIFTLIQMGEQDLDRGAKLIHAKTRQAEYEAFAGWIKACCSDPKLRDLPSLSASELAGPSKPDEVIRHNRKDRLLDSFVRNVWSQRMRCFPCHTPNELSAATPQHQKPIETHRQLVEQFGQRMNIFRESPEATLHQLLVSSRKPSPGHLPLINVKEPTQSLLVLKPTSKLPAKDAEGKFEKPSYAAPVSHMGGLKMFVDDQSYKSILAWIQDYARVAADEYASVEELPSDNWYPTKQVLRLSDTPAAWAEGLGVQLFVHAWNNENSKWEPEPIAFTQGTVTPRHMVNGMLVLLSSPDKANELDSNGAALSAGKYLIKAYADSQHRLANDPALLLSKEDFAGQAEIQAQWREGFPQAEMLSADKLQK